LPIWGGLQDTPVASSPEKRKKKTMGRKKKKKAREVLVQKGKTPIKAGARDALTFLAAT